MDPPLKNSLWGIPVKNHDLIFLRILRATIPNLVQSANQVGLWLGFFLVTQKPQIFEKIIKKARICPKIVRFWKFQLI